MAISEIFTEFESRPVTVQAVQFTDDMKDRIFRALGRDGGWVVADFDDATKRPILKVQTIHGEWAIVRFGDWIVRETKHGRYYPVAEDIFPKRYVVR